MMAKDVVSMTIIPQKRKEGMQVYQKILFYTIEIKLELTKVDCFNLRY